MPMRYAISDVLKSQYAFVIFDSFVVVFFVASFSSHVLHIVADCSGVHLVVLFFSSRTCWPF